MFLRLWQNKKGKGVVSERLFLPSRLKEMNLNDMYSGEEEINRHSLKRRTISPYIFLKSFKRRTLQKEKVKHLSILNLLKYVVSIFKRFITIFIKVKKTNV